MKKYEIEELTELEQQAIREAYNEGLGWVYFDESDIPSKQMRGVMSSLIKKGIIYVDDECDEFEAVPCKGYEDWF